MDYHYRVQARGKKKVAGGADYILPIGALALIGGILYKLGLFSGSGATDTNNAAAAAANKAATDQTAAQQKAAGEVATLSPDTVASIANTVYTLGTTNLPSGPQAVAQIQNLLMQPLNLTDLNNVIASFGTRKAATDDGIFNACATFGYNCQALDLPSFVRTVFASDSVNQTDDLNAMNSYYTLQGINFQF
jgi:hypothetical protein